MKKISISVVCRAFPNDKGANSKPLPDSCKNRDATLEQPMNESAYFSVIEITEI